jgi:hypothetical protein
MKNDHNLAYVGSFSTIKNEEVAPSEVKVGLSFNAKQSELYGRLMIGTRYYDDATLYNMNSSKKKKINALCIRARHEINMFKQRLMICKTNSLNSIAEEMFEEETNPFLNQNKTAVLTTKVSQQNIHKVFTTSLFKSLLSLDAQPDPTFICKLSMKDLGITKEDVVNLLISKQILPRNFFNIV